MNNNSKLKILEKDLLIETSGGGYNVVFEQKEFNLILVTVHGEVNYLNAVKYVSITEQILEEFEENYPKQKMYFVGNVTNISGYELKAINYTISKIKGMSNHGGYLVVGAPKLLNISILASKILLAEYLFKFFDKEDDAFLFYKDNLSIEIDEINKKYKNTKEKRTWTLTGEDNKDNFYLEFNTPDVFVTKPIGESTLDGVREAFSQFNDIHQELLNGGEYYRIHDFTDYKIKTGKTGFWYIKWVKEHIDEIKLLIFCGLDKKNKTRVNLGKLIVNSRNKIVLVDTLDDAYSVIEKHRLENKFIDTIKSSDENISVPDTKEELKELVTFLIKENKQIKETITKSSDKLLKILSEVTWTTTLSQDIDFDTDLQEPYSQLVTAIKIIYRDTQELIKCRDEEYEKSKLLEERYRTIMQIIPKISIRGYDKDLKIFFWNDACKEIFGIDKSEAIGEKLNEIDICYKCTNPIINSVKSAVLNKITGEFHPAGQNNLLNRQGEDIVIFSIHTSLFDSEGEQIFFSMDFDLTNQNRIEEELRNHKENLEELVKEKTYQLEIEKNKAQESDRLKSAFLANMSHEIRTPMNSIIGFTDLLNDSEISNEKRLKYINIIKSSGNNLMNIINDIIDISKIESEQVNIVKTHFNLCDIFSKIEKGFSNEIENIETIEFFVKDSKNENVVVFSDSQRVEQIITNFVSNAIKFTHKGTITIYCNRLYEDKIEIIVKDTGIGMSKEQAEYVFNRFRQADETTTREYGGSGLGLTISQNLASLLGGTIRVDSELGVGSSFIFELPIGKKIDENATILLNKNSQVITPSNIFSDKLVLIVEDDESSALLLIERLSNLGIKVIHADTGSKAIQFINSNKLIDIVLLDIQLPDIDGYEVINEIRKINTTIPIIAQTAFAILDEKENILNSGFNDYLSKPILKKELIRVLEQFL